MDHGSGRQQGGAVGADDLGRKEQEYLRALRAILSVLIVCAVIALLACGHHDDGLEAGRVPHLAVELLEVQGATEVRSRASSGYDELRYRVNTPYPAPDV